MQPPAPQAQADGLVPRRPRSPGALITGAFALYQRYPALFATLAAAVIVPYDVVVLIASGAGPYSYAGLDTGPQLALSAIGWLLIGPLISALQVHAVAEARDGNDPEIRAVAIAGLRVLPVVVAATIMSGLGIALGFLAFIVPGVILFLRWAVVAQVAAIEGVDWPSALRGSRGLTAGNYGHVFFFMILVGVIVAAPGSLAAFGFGSEHTSAASFAVGLVIHVFATSFGALATALLYYDLISRRGGAVQASPPPPPPGSLPPPGDPPPPPPPG